MEKDVKHQCSHCKVKPAAESISPQRVHDQILQEAGSIFIDRLLLIYKSLFYNKVEMAGILYTDAAPTEIFVWDDLLYVGQIAICLFKMLGFLH